MEREDDEKLHWRGNESPGRVLRDLANRLETDEWRLKKLEIGQYASIHEGSLTIWWYTK